MSHTKTWLITGCGGGLGSALAEEGLKRGNNVVVTARKSASVEHFEGRYPDHAMMLSLDVTDSRQITDAVAKAHSRFGSVDMLFNNAAYTLNGPVEEIVTDEYRSLFDANFFGPVELIRAVLPGMRQRRSGHIVNISSIAALSGIPGFGHYGATKAALTMLSEALAEEVRPLGIKVTTIDLGGHNTQAIEKTRLAALALDDYAGTVGAVRQMTREISRESLGDVKRAASAIVTAVYDEDPPARLPIGVDALQLSEHKLASRTAEIAKWRNLSESSALRAKAG